MYVNYKKCTMNGLVMYVMFDFLVGVTSDDRLDKRQKCKLHGVPCRSNYDCCVDLDCTLHEDDSSTCEDQKRNADCIDVQSKCRGSYECCSPYDCVRQNNGTAFCVNDIRRKANCQYVGESCNDASPCCEPTKIKCVNGICVAPPTTPPPITCAMKDQNCSNKKKCCNTKTYTCFENKCQIPVTKKPSYRYCSFEGEACSVWRVCCDEPLYSCIGLVCLETPIPPPPKCGILRSSCGEGNACCESFVCVNSKCVKPLPPPKLPAARDAAPELLSSLLTLTWSVLTALIFSEVNFCHVFG